ncbi:MULTISPECIES: DUF4145 domain-containing protein [Streptomyces]|uniref:DUF4145 domain-containing protein n=1 Tax=Streptomyces TaxID=1883 RepID=UPI00081BBC8F|nr:MULTISPECIES: DUF4145 domain-containing protein [Streptomyces]MYX85828.1 DUF4145 domain-containing protein [Streptomyces sp. SID4915]SCD78699.1 protein of unknown function [Streptomyces sp. BvitLS-983]
MGISFDREKFEKLAGPFNEWPRLLCPQCEEITLEPRIEKFESFASLELRETAASTDPDAEETDPFGFFYGELQCPRLPCGNRHIVVGEWSLEWGPASIKGSEDDPYLVGYSVRHILPELPLIGSSQEVPEDLKALISSASRVLLSDPNAAANRIRSAIECLLSHKRVKKFGVDRRGRRVRLSTHQRIELFKQVNEPASVQLMAMKWIGNAGSHEAEAIPLDHALNGIEHFARALELVYDPRERELQRRAEKIIKAKGKAPKVMDGK